VINNFLVDSFEDTAPPLVALKKAPGQRRVIFAGNLGRFQNLSRLADGVVRCLDLHPELELFFLGDGAALPELKARWGGHGQVRFAPFIPFPQARSLISEADIGLVSLARDVYRVSYPSKVLTYLGLGVPVLALVEPKSMLARKIREHGLGATPESDTPEAIGDTLCALLDGPDLTGKVRKWHQENATREISVRGWLRIIHSLAGD
jgi:glycosyltransferase involved in cell wall biosynthesis